MFEQAPKKRSASLEESFETLSKKIIDGLDEEYKEENKDKE